MSDPVSIKDAADVAVPIAADEVAGLGRVQVVKPAFGVDGAATMVSAATPLPVAGTVADLLVMMSRVVKLLESSAVVDQQQRQRVSVDAFPATVPAVTAVTTVTTVTTLSNATAIAGMDREQWINAAKQTYAQSIRARLEFV